MTDDPTPEHDWLQRLVGDWTWEAEPVPGQTFHPMHASETVRALGKLWIQGESRGDHGINQLTLGYEPRTRRYVGTWVGSNAAHLWVYEGVREGDRLRLHARGPSMAMDGTLAEYVDEIELVGPDERVLRASYQGADGGWTHFMTMRYRRA